MLMYTTLPEPCPVTMVSEMLICGAELNASCMPTTGGLPLETNDESAPLLAVAVKNENVLP